jgi:hypothetical protein
MGVVDAKPNNIGLITLPKTLNKREKLEIPNILTRDG